MSARKYGYFRPKRAAAWITTIEDLLWPDIKIVKKIEKMAKSFSDAGIDLAINYGFHMRFDFSDYFERLNGYYKNVCDELHKYGIRFMDHYSCNLIERPKPEDFHKLHNTHRHHVLLHKDPASAEFAQYAGYRFRDLCEVDVKTGELAYNGYQAEMFCHNNPNFIAMHKTYLERMLEVVPLDAMEIDDMCDYGGMTSCACDHCKAKFKELYGHDLPPFEDKEFWGDTTRYHSYWGNYENPVFRDWIRFKTNGILEHVKMVKSVLGDRPLMTCCSATGSMALNPLGLNLERLMDDLDLLMLENCGMGIDVTDWTKKDAEALLQKDIAKTTMGGAPAVALSYQTYDPSAYLGWALARFWGATNWGSTMIGRLAYDPGDIRSVPELMAPTANWEDRYSAYAENTGEEFFDIRLVNNLHCRENGHRDENGKEHWADVSAWSKLCVENNLGYRFLRYRELGDAAALKAERTPLVLANMGAVSDRQYAAIKEYLADGGTAIVSLPFGTLDENGFKRETPLSEELLRAGYPKLVVIEKADDDTIKALIKDGVIQPTIRQLSGETTWALRMRVNEGHFHLHLLNRALEPIAHEALTGAFGNGKILKDFKKTNEGGEVSYLIREDIPENLAVMSPEYGSVQKPVRTEKTSEGIKITFDMADYSLYAVVQEKK